MKIQVDKTVEIDTDKDLGPIERHVLQKLFGWKDMAASVGEFRRKKKEALAAGWNGSGPIRESGPLALVIGKLEREVAKRSGGRG